ncbi:MAG: hypothetical protein KA801_02080 [Syntrophorhabdaceae bacterium]|nr:hypothetical protein [Syntrophorhabdaceae bacterium]
MAGGGPRAFQKYESGDLLPSRAISSALVPLDHNPKGLMMLKARQEEDARPVHSVSKPSEIS